MVSYGNVFINLLDDVNEALVHFSYDYDDDNLSTEEMVSLLISFGLVYLGYLKYICGDFIYDCEDYV